MLSNGLIGLGLVMLMLSIFLNWHSAFWVALSIPVVLLGTLFLLVAVFYAKPPIAALHAVLPQPLSLAASWIDAIEVGAFLPPAQGSLEVEWKREMRRLHGVVFNDLYTITNMPISRFLEWLESSGKLEDYMQKLVSAFNPAAAEGVMCRSTLSVDWRGELYDCDFNQMLDIPVLASDRRHIADLLQGAQLEGAAIATGEHCYGCTAGQGSSCGGALEG